MEEFEEDDFSNLYADFEVQASCAISAIHRSTKLTPRSGSIVANAARGAEIGGGHRKFDKRDAACEVAEEKGCRRNFPVENYDVCERRLASASKSKDGLNSDGGDGIERRIDEVFDDEKYDDHESDEEIGGISGKEKSADGGDYGSQRKELMVKLKGLKRQRLREDECKVDSPCFPLSCLHNEWIEGFVDTDMSSEEFVDVLNPNTRTIIISIRFEKRVLKLKYADSYNFPYHAVVGGDEFKFLKKLSLNDTSINGEFVKEVVQSNRFLQHLSLTGAADVTEVEIIDPSPVFKCLEISLCHNIGSLVIRNSNIVTLKLMTSVRMEVVLENVPHLVEFCCWPDALTVSMEDFREMFSSVFPQLRRLKLYILLWHLDKKDTIKFSGADLSNLSELVVVDDGLRKEGGLMEEGVFDLINASHKLEKFVLVSPEDYSSIPNSNPHTRKGVRARRAGKKIPKKYPCLKEMEIVGYRGLHHEFEMIMHLIENGVALRNIVVDTHSVIFHSETVHSRDGSDIFTNSWDYIPKQNIRSKNAYELIKYVPSRINLTILE